LIKQSGLVEAPSGVPAPQKKHRRKVEMSPEEKKLNRQYVEEI
jgi:hypothetical protein